MANSYEDQYNQTTPKNPPKKPAKKPKPPLQGHGAGSGTGPPKVTKYPNYNPTGTGTGSTNAAEYAFGIPDLPKFTAPADPYNGWDAQSLIDETLADSGWYGDSSSSGSGGGRRGGGGGGGGGGGASAALTGELAGADAQTAALQAYLAQLQGTQGLREQPFNDAKSNLAAMYAAAKGTIGQAQTDVQARLGANSSAVQQALADYVAQSGQLNQQASGSGRAELGRLMTDLRAQGLDTGQLQGQANLQDAALQQAFLRDQQRNAALGQANTDAFASRDSTAGLVNASALGGLEANNLGISGQIGQAQAAAMLQFQQELAQAQLQVAQQQAQADAIRAQLGLPPASNSGVNNSAVASPAVTPAPVVGQTPSAAPASAQPAPVTTLGDVARPGGQPLVDPALVQQYIQQMNARPTRPNGKRPLQIALPRGR
jgi:hypothetical protein